MQMDPKTETLVSIVRVFNKRVRNGRTQDTIVEHMSGEVVELKEEIEKDKLGLAPGSDGIVGENLDIIACALDSIFEHAPEITDEQLNRILITKCEKWERKYG